MKYAITHCYTDKNKGDAAIIVATSKLVRDLDSNAEIKMFSTYRVGDQRLNEEHEIIRRHAEKVHPALFGEPVPYLFGWGKWTRSLSFILDFIRYSMLLISKNEKYINLFLKKEEINALADFLESDVIISKGGSFLFTENTSVRQTLSLVRLLYPFMLARRYGKRVYIFSQSLGPVEGVVNRYIFKTALKNVSGIYLRESLCLEKYEPVSELCNEVPFGIVPDTAFYLGSDVDEAGAIDIDRSQFNVGFTVVDHDFKYLEDGREREIRALEYKNSLIESVKYLVDTHGAVVRIFPQVIVDNSYLGHNDIKMSREIVNAFAGTRYEDSVIFHEGDWSPSQLRCMYSKMDIFVGTRLHSVIFSLSCSVPSVNISYHGTKSQGILAGIDGIGSCVVDINKIDKHKLIEKISFVIENREALRLSLRQQMPQIRTRLRRAMEEIMFS
ncbi:polysaccharide pyruvyl transferase family protein [Marinobacter salarius]|uniref:polysaccharide pyruvyl transferase family protein n=1 Tax=Marinobacter salarius TaxID=1420917 RepID=UPI00321284FB